jgi:hypothetical protein
MNAHQFRSSLFGHPVRDPKSEDRLQVVL